MPTTAIYDKAHEQYEAHRAEIKRKVLAALQAAPEHHLTRMALAVLVYGRDVNMLTADRNIREAVGELICEGQPIIATSGEAGYHIAASALELEPVIAEHESRIKALARRKAGLEAARAGLAPYNAQQSKLF